MFEKIQKELADYFEIDPSTITRQTDFAKDLQADSLAVMELIFDLETETGITIDDDVMESIKTVGDLSDYLDSKL